jgi:hypothetical protein
VSGAGGFASDHVAALAADVRHAGFAQALTETLVAPESTPAWREAARRALERSTYISYFAASPHHGTYADAVPRDGAEAAPFQVKDHAPVAEFYRTWLAGEGHDPAGWLPLARGRARAILASEDMSAIYGAATFLQSPLDAPRDDDPAATAARLAAILDELEFQRLEPTDYGGFAVFTRRGAPLPVTVGNWTQMLARCGPAARAHAPTLIRIARALPAGDWGMLSNLAAVGGAEAMDHLAAVLPQIEAELARRGLNDPEHLDPLADADQFAPDRLGRRWFYAGRVARFGLDRWLGRTFRRSDERLAAWKQVRDQNPEAYLRANLPNAAAAADAGDVVAAAVVQLALPDAPKPETPRLWSPIGVFKLPDGAAAPTTRLPDGVTRSGWLREHAERLRYDAAAHALRLPQ